MFSNFQIGETEDANDKSRRLKVDGSTSWRLTVKLMAAPLRRLTVKLMAASLRRLTVKLMAVPLRRLTVKLMAAPLWRMYVKVENFAMQRNINEGSLLPK